MLKFMDILLKRSRFTMGDYSYYASKPVVIGRFQDIIIGKFCSIGHNVTFVSMGHYTGNYSTYPFSKTKNTKNLRDIDCEKYGGCPVYGHIEIGNDVWIGANSTIVGPCIIGDGAVIGAGSVIRGKVPPYSVVYGNPATVAYYRFNKEKISKLLSMQWWNNIKFQ